MRQHGAAAGSEEFGVFAPGVLRNTDDLRHFGQRQDLQGDARAIDQNVDPSMQRDGGARALLNFAPVRNIHRANVHFAKFHPIVDDAQMVIFFL